MSQSRKRSGRNIPESQRKTAKLQLRVHVDVAKWLRETSRARGCTVSHLVSVLVLSE